MRIFLAKASNRQAGDVLMPKSFKWLNIFSIKLFCSTMSFLASRNVSQRVSFMLLFCHRCAANDEISVGKSFIKPTERQKNWKEVTKYRSRNFLQLDFLAFLTKTVFPISCFFLVLLLSNLDWPARLIFSSQAKKITAGCQLSNKTKIQEN